MSRRLAVLVAAVFCALAPSAISASGASAGATAFTCVAGEGAANTNADCEPGSSGTSGHVPITEGISTALTLKGLSNSQLTLKISGATTELEATGLECVECTVVNKEVGGVVEVTGSGGKLRFTGVSVPGFPACIVNGGTLTTPNLKFTTTSPTGVTFEPETGTLMFEFNITGSTCSIAGSGYKITGKASAALNGSKLTFNITKASEELRIEGGQVALKALGTLEAGSGGTNHPLSLTTATAPTGTTGFTCVSGGSEGASKFSDADCATSSGSGAFGHAAIAPNTSTTVAMAQLGSPVLEGKLFGSTVQLEATGTACLECTVQNKEVGGVKEVSGSGGKLKFTGVTAVGFPKCNVNGGTITTEALKFTTTSRTGVTLEPEAGTSLAVFSITGSECSLAGSNFKITGKAAATLSGAKLAVNVTKASGELLLEGEKASLKGESTLEAGTAFHPLALTTGVFAGTTAFTCVVGGTAGPNKFSDDDCTTINNATGTVGHTAIGESTATTVRPRKLSSPVLTGKLFGATVELTAAGIECPSCTLENKEVSGAMEVTGSGYKLKFTGVTIVGAPKCNVNGGTITTEPLKFTTTSSTGATIEPESGTKLAVFNITGSECSVAGTNITATGKASATLSGSKLNFNVSKSSLQLQLEGEKAALTGEATIEAGAGELPRPVALTGA